jgi:hypothetical protein
MLEGRKDRGAVADRHDGISVAYCTSNVSLAPLPGPELSRGSYRRYLAEVRLRLRGNVVVLNQAVKKLR